MPCFHSHSHFRRSRLSTQSSQRASYGSPQMICYQRLPRTSSSRSPLSVYRSRWTRLFLFPSLWLTPPTGLLEISFLRDIGIVETFFPLHTGYPSNNRLGTRSLRGYCTHGVAVRQFPPVYRFKEGGKLPMNILKNKKNQNVLNLP